MSVSSLIPLKAQTFAPHTQERKPESKLPTELLENFTGRLFLLSRRKKPGGGRGEICPISPQTWVETDEQAALEPVTVKLLNPQPLFLWTTNDSTVTAIEVFEDSEEPQEPIWTAEVSEGQTHIIYQGKPLQPEKIYYWRVQAIGPKKQTYFQIIPEQNRIQQDLQQREEELKRQGVSVEEIAIEKAYYLADKEFWSDGLRELFLINDLVKNTSSDVEKAIRDIRTHNFCER